VPRARREAGDARRSVAERRLGGMLPAIREGPQQVEIRPLAQGQPDVTAMHIEVRELNPELVTTCQLSAVMGLRSNDQVTIASGSSTIA